MLYTASSSPRTPPTPILTPPLTPSSPSPKPGLFLYLHYTPQTLKTCVLKKYIPVLSWNSEPHYARHEFGFSAHKVKLDCGVQRTRIKVHYFLHKNRQNSEKCLHYTYYFKSDTTKSIFCSYPRETPIKSWDHMDLILSRSQACACQPFGLLYRLKDHKLAFLHWRLEWAPAVVWRY